jgi:hypothetical protein
MFTSQVYNAESVSVMLVWGSLALLQCTATNFAGLLVLRLLLGYITNPAFKDQAELRVV